MHGDGKIMFAGARPVRAHFAARQALFEAMVVVAAVVPEMEVGHDRTLVGFLLALAWLRADAEARAPALWRPAAVSTNTASNPGQRALPNPHANRTGRARVWSPPAHSWSKTKLTSMLSGRG